MFLCRNKKNIGTFQMKKAPSLGLCVCIAGSEPCFMCMSHKVPSYDMVHTLLLISIHTSIKSVRNTLEY